MNIILGIVYVVLIVILPYYTYLCARRIAICCSAFLAVATGLVVSFAVGFCWQYLHILLHASPTPSTEGYSSISGSILAGGFSIAFGTATIVINSVVHYIYSNYIRR